MRRKDEEEEKEERGERMGRMRRRAAGTPIPTQLYGSSSPVQIYS